MTARPGAFDGPVAIVTGATGGIGSAIARTLDDRGYALILTGYRDEAQGRRLADSCTSATYIDVDLSTPDGADRVVNVCRQTFGRVDLLVNNAGIGIPVPHRDLDAVSADFFTRMLEINLLGPWHLTRAAADLLSRSEGSVVNVTSVAASTVSGSSIPYAVSKAGLEHLTRCLAVAMGPRVRVNAIAPGYIETDRTRGWEAIRTHVVEHAPAARIGQPDDVASAVIALTEARYTTGAVLPVDGGLRLV